MPSSAPEQHSVTGASRHLRPLHQQISNPPLAFRPRRSQRQAPARLSDLPPPTAPRVPVEKVPKTESFAKAPAPAPRVSPPPVPDTAPPPAPVPRVQAKVDPTKTEQPVAQRTQSRRKSAVQPVAQSTRSKKNHTTFKATLMRAFGVIAAAGLAAAFGSAVPPHRPPTVQQQPNSHERQPAAPTVSEVSCAAAAGCKYPVAFLLHLAYPVLDETTGKSLEYRHLNHHSALSTTWL